MYEQCTLQINIYTNGLLAKVDNLRDKLLGDYNLNSGPHLLAGISFGCNQSDKS